MRQSWVADLWLRNAEERGKHHAGQSRGGVYMESRPGVFRFVFVRSAESVFNVVYNVGSCSLKSVGG
jgi:hypothetical protein